MPERVKVRAALVVNEHGKWNVYGWSGASDDNEVMGVCLDGFDEAGMHEQTYWLTAEVDVPSVPELAASVATVERSTDEGGEA